MRGSNIDQPDLLRRSKRDRRKQDPPGGLGHKGLPGLRHALRAEGHLDKQLDQIDRGGRVDDDYQNTLSYVGLIGQVPGLILITWGHRELEHGINALKDLESTPTPPEPRALEPRAPRRPRRRGQLIPAR